MAFGFSDFFFSPFYYLSILHFRDWQAVSIKVKVDTLSFAGHSVSVATTQLCGSSLQSAIDKM